jgi:hypothetical protein
VSEESGISEQTKKDLSEAERDITPLTSDVGEENIVVSFTDTAHNSCNMSSCSSCSTTYLSVTFERLAVSAAAAATDREQPNSRVVLRQRNHSDGGGVRRRTNSRRQQLPPSSLLRPSKLTAVNKHLLPHTSTLPENENSPVTVTAAAAAGGVTLRDKERRCEIKETAVTTTGVAAAVFGGDFSAAFENFASLSLDGSKAAASTTDKILASGAGYRSPSVGILKFFRILVQQTALVFLCYKFCVLLYLVQLKRERLPVPVVFLVFETFILT